MFVSLAGVSVVRGMQILRVEGGQRVVVVAQSAKPELMVTHWFNRQYVCPGDGCPACGVYQSRLTAFFVVTVQCGEKWQQRLCELSAQSLSRLKFMAGWEDMCLESGMGISLTRSSRRKPVFAEPLEFRGEVWPELVGPEVLLDAIGILMKLPARMRLESGRDWCERIRPFCVAQLEQAIRTAG